MAFREEVIRIITITIKTTLGVNLKDIQYYLAKAVTIAFFFIFFIAINYLDISQRGATGLQLPPNGAVWMGIAGLIVLAFYRMLFIEKLKISKLTIPLLITLCLMVAPGLISTDALARDVILRVSQVVGFFLLFFAFTQFKLSQHRVNFFLYLVVFSSIIQIIYVLAQLHHNLGTTPQFLLFYLGDNRPPVGGFLQKNTLSIFFVTSIIISIYLYYQPSFKTQNMLKKLSLVLAILGGSYLVVIINSLAAFVALFISVPLIFLSQKRIFKKGRKQRFWGLVLVLSLCSGLLLGVTSNNGVDLTKDSTNTRVHIWKLSYQAIKEKPLLGHGLGSFSKAFYDENEKYNAQLLEGKRQWMPFFSHPHNEFLYWGVESGIIAIIAMVGFLIFFLWLLFRKSWRYGLKYTALLFPIAFHTQVSYPFYLSPILMVLFLFIISVSLRAKTKEHSIALSEIMKKTSVIFITVCFGTYIWFVKETINGGANYALFIHSGANNFGLLAKALKSPYWWKEQSRISNFSNMQRQNLKGSEKGVQQYLSWFEEQIKRDENPQYYSILLRGYKLVGDEKNHKKIEAKFLLRHPQKR